MHIQRRSIIAAGTPQTTATGAAAAAPLCNVPSARQATAQLQVAPQPGQTLTDAVNAQIRRSGTPNIWPTRPARLSHATLAQLPQTLVVKVATPTAQPAPEARNFNFIAWRLGLNSDALLQFVPMGVFRGAAFALTRMPSELEAGGETSLLAIYDLHEVQLSIHPDQRLKRDPGGRWYLFTAGTTQHPSTTRFLPRDAVPNLTNGVEFIYRRHAVHPALTAR